MLPSRLALVLLASALPALAAEPVRWPAAPSPIKRDAAQEARIEQILASMTLPQKVGQMTQPEIKFITPEQVKRFYIGSVLNGGGAWPGGNKYAALADWVKLAEAYHQASLATDMKLPVPVIWGTDAVHGHNNVLGTTLFPHNMALGATRNPALVAEIGTAVARQVRASGIPWTFAPTLAVSQDMRWGRAYESYSADPAVVEQLGAAFVRGLQGQLGTDESALATAKHFIGDGGTHLGRDQGQTRATEKMLRDTHGRGYYGALGAGAQTVMASFNSWFDTRANKDEGKLHGQRHLMTTVLKEQMGFDGLIVSDWNGIGQVAGCSDTRCAQAINAGIDMVMVPEHWQEFIRETIAQVERGEIPMARIDDAVRRILRVKLRAGLFDKSPAQNRLAGQADALLARELARRAVRESLVLLKNEGQVLPLRRDARVLVVGKSADSMENQTGGWTLSWQGTGNKNSDFAAGQTVLAGLRETLGEQRVSFSIDGRGVRLADYDAVIAVIGETPYAEGNGDIPPWGTLRHADRHPEDLAALQAVAGQGKPVITVFISGRPLHVNDLINASDAFVAAWLPGTEGGGVADLLVQGGAAFKGKLPFDWPQEACPRGGKPLFALGYGLQNGQKASVAKLSTKHTQGGCAASKELMIFERAAQAPYALILNSPTNAWPELRIGDDLNGAWTRPDVVLTTTDMHQQQDAKRLRWSGPAKVLAYAAQRVDLQKNYRDGALVFDLRVEQAASQAVKLAMGHREELDLSAVIAQAPLNKPRRFVVPLSCFAAAGADLGKIEIPFALSTTGPFTASLARIRIETGAAKRPEAIACSALKS